MIKAAAGFEPAMRILQTLALPLGHAAIDAIDKDSYIKSLRVAIIAQNKFHDFFSVLFGEI